MLSSRLGRSVTPGELAARCGLYIAGVAPVGACAFAAAMALGAALRTAPYAVLGQGIGSGSLATILIAGASIASARGRPPCWCDASAPPSLPPELASATGNAKAAAAP